MASGCKGEREEVMGGLKAGRRQTGTLGQMYWDHWLSPSWENRNSVGHAGY